MDEELKFVAQRLAGEAKSELSGNSGSRARPAKIFMHYLMNRIRS